MCAARREPPSSIPGQRVRLGFCRSERTLGGSMMPGRAWVHALRDRLLSLVGFKRAQAVAVGGISRSSSYERAA